MNTQPQTRTHYTHWDVLFASPTEPLATNLRVSQLTRMWSGLASIETGDCPTTDDWRLCSDAVNLMETFVVMGKVQDTSGLLMDAITALAMAGKRHLGGAQIRLDGPGIQAVRAVLEDYDAVLEALPARTVMACHRTTEQRLQKILAGKRQPHDVEIVSL